MDATVRERKHFPDSPSIQRPVRVALPAREPAEAVEVKPGEPTRRRAVTMALLGLAAAAVALLLGFPRAAAGVVAGGVLGLLNFELFRKLVAEDKGLSPRGVQTVFLLRSVGRMVVSWGALLLAVPFGVEAVFGVLVGLLLEIGTYYGDVMMLILRRR